jgi:hypothetical protein
MFGKSDTTTYEIMELNTTTLSLRIFKTSPDMNEYYISERTYIRQ